MIEYIMRSDSKALPTRMETIVRCRDCKHYVRDNSECDRMGYEQEGASYNGFCAWGERKECANG